MGVGLCGGVSLTCHMLDSPLLFPPRTIYPCLCNFIVVAVNVAVPPSSHSFHMEVSAPYWRWGKMWDIFYLVDSKGLISSSVLWVAYLLPISIRIPRGPCEFFILLLHGVSTLM